MEYRNLGHTGWRVSAISFGTWAIGGQWGRVDERESLEALNRALDRGVNFFDTADVYGSEPLLATLRGERREQFWIATKAGRRLNPHTSAGYNRENITRFVEDSLRNLRCDTLDLLQLHCPPTGVYYRPEVFGILDELVAAGKIRFYGVSVEKVEEGLKALEYPGVQSIQIIFNLFRQRPADLFLAQAKQRGVGVLARVPLASGLLTGKIRGTTKFPRDDHRNFNRYGEAFDRGETFAGVDLAVGMRAVKALEELVPVGQTLAQLALRWILMFDAVTCAIPGAKRASQVEENVRAADLPPLSGQVMESLAKIYEEQIRPLVHQLW
jgi:aryl-alcohol dehydrogenase-like predicted oxidoreductase